MRYSVEELDRNLAYASFPYFAFVVGKEVMEREELRQGETYIFKEFHKRWAQDMQECQRYLLAAFRTSKKSVMLRLRAMWRMWRLKMGEQNPEYEALYLSLTEPLAAKHTAKLKRYIKGSPLFKDVVDETDAESVIKMRLPNGKRFMVEPGGVLGGQRGQHPDELFLDDILGDVTTQSVPMDIATINKVTDIILSSLQYLPRANGAIIGAGTPQTSDDFFAVAEGSVEGYEKEMGGLRWKVERFPVEDVNGKSVMPELYPDERLVALRGTDGSRQWIAYQKEMLVRPSRQIFKTFLPKGLIETCIVPEEPFGEPSESVGALDMGKRVHPGHLVFFAPTSGGRIKQILSRWYDKCELREMIADASEYAELFNARIVYVDNTRADFEAVDEQGFVVLSEKDEFGNDIPETRRVVEITRTLTPIVITRKVRWPMGQRMRLALESGKVLLLPDDRQKRQLLLVDQQLEAAETAEGHAEPFTTIGLAIQAAFECGMLREEEAAKQEPKREGNEIIASLMMQASETQRATPTTLQPGAIRA